MSEQRQHVLRGTVGLGQDRGVGLHQDLRPRQGRRFRREVGVADGAFAGRHVFQRDVQAVDVGVEDVLLERAQSAAQRGDLADRVGQDLLCLDGVAATSELAPPLPRLDRKPTTSLPSVVVETEPMPIWTWPWRLTSEPSWNLAPPPVM